MAYRELIGHFNRVRAFMQHFYVYGFRTRDEFGGVSPRAYDDERRRVEGWLGEFMGYRMTEQGKAVFLSFDSRELPRNPLHAALKSKTFTDRDVTLHFLLLDILAEGENAVPELLEEVARRIDRTDADMSFDLSTLRIKLAEYESLGLLTSRMDGRRRVYRLAESPDIAHLADALAFFTQAAECGVIGSFLEDRLADEGVPLSNAFRMKHRHLTATLDSDVLCHLLDAIHRGRNVTLRRTALRSGQEVTAAVTPLFILESVQDGRSYLACWDARTRCFQHQRIDRIQAVEMGETAPDFADRRAAYLSARAHCWGTSLRQISRTKRIEFTIRHGDWERHIPQRLRRECRCGTVEEVEPGLLRFTADVYDPEEMLPWVRTFIGRIVDFRCELPRVEAKFRRDLAQMAALYGLEVAQ